MCFVVCGVLKRGLLPAVIAALLVSPSVAGAETTLVRGVTYQRLHLIVGGRPVVLHVVRTPPDGGLYQLEPVLSNGDVLGRQTVPAMQRATARRATSVGVNGDYFGWATGRPSGVFMRDGVLAATPLAGRSALAIQFDGRLVVDRFRLEGTLVDWDEPRPSARRAEPSDRPAGRRALHAEVGRARRRRRGRSWRPSSPASRRRS